LPSLASNVAVMIGAGGLGAALRRFWPLYLGAVVGVGAGVILLGRAEEGGPAALLGAALIAFAAFSLGRPHWRLAPALGRRLAAPTGLATGLVNGLTGSQVMPVVPYLMALRLERVAFVMAVNLSFTLSSLVMLAGLAHLGLVTGWGVLLSALGVPVVFAAVAIGARLRRRLPEAAFRKAVLSMLALAGLSLILGAL
ncbi:MAG: TSUP family transporter, partial [Pseudomonadota bacterium]